jgi:hypothetical protein
MRISMGLAALGLLALAGCSSPPDTSAPAQAVSADAQQQSAPAARKPKTCPTGQRLCGRNETAPDVGVMSGQALGDATRGHAPGWIGPQ